MDWSDSPSADGVPGRGVHSLETDDITRSDAPERAGDEGLDPGPDGQVTRDIRRDARIRRMPHQRQLFLQPRSRKHRKKRGLPELHRHGVPQHLVEDRLPRVVGDVGDQDPVALDEQRRARPWPPSRRGRDADQDEHRRCRDAAVDGRPSPAAVPVLHVA